MLVRTRHHGQWQRRPRRGIVLVLVLAMMSLLAVIGVTFATLSAQAKINARNFAQSVIRPQEDELMDFALQQLITDTDDIRSAIRGHSLARDMYGNDAFNNGYLTSIPPFGGQMQITAIQAAGSGYFDVATNIPVPTQNAAMYGYNFERWILRMTYVGPQPTNTLYPRAVSQTFQILIDDFNGSSGIAFSGQGTHAFRIGLIDPAVGTYSNPPANTYANYPMPYSQTVLNNPSLGFTTPGMFPGWDSPGSNSLPLAYTPTQMALMQWFSPFLTNSAYQNYQNYQITLDGRWLHAFNGPGLSAQPVAFNMSWSTTTGQNYSISTTVPMSTYGNFRYNGLHPNSIGMDEDYDACDLENWFLAIQSADGQVMIPSFHRPGIVRYQDQNNRLDWDPNPGGFRRTYFLDSASRILRPVAADGHDANTFHDLVPDPVTGKITYDVDNDADGITDSVWVDLGYPARRDPRGNLYKPLFAFMVIGLNGRIPLNTAGNLAGGGATHAQHLGNSPSEIDPTYALQNAFSFGQDQDPFNQIGNLIGTGFPGPNFNTQVDNAINPISGAYLSIDVRLTQLRNMLAGTRPQPNPYVNPKVTDPNGTINGDHNLVYGAWPGRGQGALYCLPNSIADGADVPITTYTPPNAPGPLPYVQRETAPVGGRWGEASSVAGVPFSNPAGGPPLNLVQFNYANPPRAGYSFDIADLFNAMQNGTASYDSNGDAIFPRDAADDNYNAFDMWPPRYTGEVGDTDLYDSAGALMLPVERMRRFVTPMDINGTGEVSTWMRPGRRSSNYGPDNFGRVQFTSYFRPAGIAGPINSVMSFANPPAGASPYGAITPGPNSYYSTWSNGTPTAISGGETYLPDVTNNPYHGYESYKIPNQLQNPGGGASNPLPPASVGGMPIDQPPGSGNYPSTFPTYDNMVNSKGRLDGVNEADEMNLYSPNPLLDSPFGPVDLEWLYRQQDVDGASLTSRLSQLAPISFTNTIDGQRRRRLFSYHTWDTNQYAWANDNPGGTFSPNATFNGLGNAILPNPDYPNSNTVVPINVANTGFASLSAIATAVNNSITWRSAPGLANRQRRINLNFPLPVSNDCNEPIRQRWITDTYNLLKAVLPPMSVDTPEELAQLSQFVINIVDFRDPDATMTHWVNNDVWIQPGSVSGTYTSPPSLRRSGYNGAIPLDQYGMEYNPVAINEVLAFAFQTRQNTTPGGFYTNRVLVELVNTLTAAYNPEYSNTNPYYGYGNGITAPMQASTLDLGGFAYTAGDPYAGGCWDLVFTADNPMARPDPYRGDLLYTSGITYYGLVPLNRDAMTTSTASGSNLGGPNASAPNGGDVTLIPVPPFPSFNTALSSGGIPSPAVSTIYYPPATQPTAPTPPINYYYVVGSPPTAGSGGSTSYEYPSPIGLTGSSTQGSTTGSTTNVTQFFSAYYDPMGTTNVTGPPNFVWHQGILPNVQGTAGHYTAPSNYSWKLPIYSFGSKTSGGGPTLPPGGANYFWVCLRRPANPFAPVSAANPMVVVDSMRFPYIDGTANPGMNWFNPNGQVVVTNGTTGGYANTIYSAQRLQPYRGGHAVPMPNAPGATAPTISSAYGPTVTTMPPDPRYGYTEQTAAPFTWTQSGGGSGTYGLSSAVGANTKFASTNYIFHTLGFANDSSENWDYFVFNDRDFTSVAELLLVPGCPPGLFTKQFVEFAPSQINAANIFSAITPIYAPSFTSTFPANNMPLPVNYNSTSSSTTNFLPTPFTTATVPFLNVVAATNLSAIGAQNSASLPSTVPAFSLPTPPNGFSAYTQTVVSNNFPVVPHAFPYLVDKFFYTGASAFYYPPAGTVGDIRGTLVGGPGGDGWYKMLEFFEVPSQAMGAVGPVALGANFDWARQDFRPGQMNLNLIIDEEAFYAVFGSQNSGNYNQDLLNSIQLPLLATFNSNTSQPTLPYRMPLATMNNGLPPIALGGSPVPLVVSAIQPNGAPNYAYPVTDQTQYIQHGYLANDPITVALQVGAGATLPTTNLVGNRIKAAFAQFLWARHGGSGYIFGYGNGSTGQNSAVITQSGQLNAYPVPAERPFRSLSYPDINLTIMRPAALPPSPASNPTLLADPSGSYIPQVYSAGVLNVTHPANSPGGSRYFLTNDFYSPYISNTNFPANTPVVYTGDPGVRNPFFNPGYYSNGALLPSPYTVATGPLNANSASFTVVPGMPLPTNVAFPATKPLTDTIVMPPPIPPARLFQVPDAFGATLMASKGYAIMGTNGLVENIPPAVSNATDSGDPWIVNFVANQVKNPGLASAVTYSLNNAFTSLVWAGGALYNSTAPYLTPTGVLPSLGLFTNYSYVPGFTSGTPAGGLILRNGYPATPTTVNINRYLGGQTAGTNTDDRQHPYWRTEMLQKAMNLTTVRTHQYAVWITIGMFEVKRRGDIAMLAQGQPWLAYDIMGPEVGALNGEAVRYRGFFIVDRLQLHGFNPGDIGGFQSAVIYRKIIE